MARKRKASRLGPTPGPAAQRPRVSNEDEEDEGRPRQHFVNGQQSAFPGLDEGGDELSYDDDNGIDYLREVR